MERLKNVYKITIEAGSGKCEYYVFSHSHDNALKKIKVFCKGKVYQAFAWLKLRKYMKMLFIKFVLTKQRSICYFEFAEGALQIILMGIVIFTLTNE